MVKDSCLSLSHHCCHSRKLQVRQRAQKDSSSSPYITSREVPCDTLAIPLTRIQMYLGPCVATQEFEKYCLCMAPASDSPPVAWEGEWVAACSTGVLWVLLASVSVSLSSFLSHQWICSCYPGLVSTVLCGVKVGSWDPMGQPGEEKQASAVSGY